jgi:hypothetical protein
MALIESFSLNLNPLTYSLKPKALKKKKTPNGRKKNGEKWCSLSLSATPNL